MSGDYSGTVNRCLLLMVTQCILFSVKGQSIIHRVYFESTTVYRTMLSTEQGWCQKYYFAWLSIKGVLKCRVSPSQFNFYGNTWYTDMCIHIVLALWQVQLLSVLNTSRDKHTSEYILNYSTAKASKRAASIRHRFVQPLESEMTNSCCPLAIPPLMNQLYSAP